MVEQLQGRLHQGEVEVIIGAKELGIQTVVIDDRSARNLAEALLFTTIGVIGILLLVKRTGKFTEVRPYLDDMGQGGYRISKKLYAGSLEKLHNKNLEGVRLCESCEIALYKPFRRRSL